MHFRKKKLLITFGFSANVFILKVPSTIIVSVPHNFQSGPSSFSSTQFELAVLNVVDGKQFQNNIDFNL